MNYIKGLLISLLILISLPGSLCLQAGQFDTSAKKGDSSKAYIGANEPFKCLKQFDAFFQSIFHCNGVPVVISPKGFWVSKDWECPHYGFRYSKGFYPYGYVYGHSLPYGSFWMYGRGLYSQSNYPHPYISGIYPTYKDVEKKEPWYKFIQKYLKEHPEQTDKSNKPQKNQE